MNSATECILHETQQKVNDMETLSRRRPLPHVNEDIEVGTPDSFNSTRSSSFFYTSMSFLAFLSGLAAFSCALGALVGTAWVDTWEPIFLPRSEEMSTVFGTGYGQLGYGLSVAGDKQKTKTVYVKASKPLGFVDGDQAIATEETLVLNVSSSSSTDDVSVYTVGPHLTDTTFVLDSFEKGDVDGSHSMPVNSNATRHHNVPELDEDYDEEYYFRDEATEDDLRQSEGIDSYKSLLVVFRVGLWRACPFLTRGDLPPHIVLPNLPCVGLGYSAWKPLNGRSFRLWRDIEFTPDFLNKLRYAMPCVLLGTLISLVAVIVAITGRCVMADKTLVCSSLHILAGLSLGSALVVFVSILHEDFYQPAAVTLTGAASQAAAAAAQIGSQATSHGGLYSDLNINSKSNPTPLPSFRYGWSFYIALVAFINAEVSAGLYIVVHSHAFKWARQSKTPLLLSRVRQVAAYPARTAIRDSAVQTSPSRGIAKSATNQESSSEPQCDLLAQNPIIKEHQSNPSPVYANAIPFPADCPCQVHLAPRRPKMNVAGIYKASTMPRKVTTVSYDEVYQQTPL